ncbi:MAG: cytochrome c, partial [Candidatus Brocadiales bacterium]
YYIFGSGSVQGSFAPQETCCYCHGNGGVGTTFGKQAGVPDFTDAEWQGSRTDEQLMETMLGGKDKMPSYRGKQTENMMKKLLQVVRNFGKK